MNELPKLLVGQNSKANEPMFDGILVDIEAEKIRIGLKQLPHAPDEAIRSFGMARVG